MNHTTSLDGDDELPTEPSDDQIISAVRGGDIGDFALLWRRHVAAARRAARAISPSVDPDDLVSEAFASILRVTKAGGGPSDAFRPYLLATLRNTAARWSRGAGMLSIEVVSELELAPEGNDPIERISERSSVAAVFGTLSARHRTLLWYLDVEGMKPRELAPLMGITPNAVSALALRARDSFRRAWLEAHIHDPSRSDDCRWFCERVVTQRERRLRGDDAVRFRAHMSTCRGCQLVAAEIDTVSQRLRTVLPAALLGGVAAGLYPDYDAASADDFPDAEPWSALVTSGPSAPAAHAISIPSVTALTEGVGLASHVAASVAVSAGGWAALVAATVVAAGAVVVAAALLVVPAPEATGDASSIVETQVPAEEHPSGDRAPDPAEITPLPSPSPVMPDTPDTRDVSSVLVMRGDPDLAGAPASPAPVASPVPVASAPVPTTEPGGSSSTGTGTGTDSTIDASSLDGHVFGITRSIPPGTRVPPRIEGTGAPGSRITAFDENGAPLDAATVDDDGEFVLDVSGDRLHQGMTVRVQQHYPRTGITEWADGKGPLVFAVPDVAIGDPDLCRLPSELGGACLSLRAERGAWVEFFDAQGRSQVILMPPATAASGRVDLGVAAPVVAARYVDPSTGRSGVTVSLPEAVG